MSHLDDASVLEKFRRRMAGIEDLVPPAPPRTKPLGVAETRRGSTAWLTPVSAAIAAAVVLAVLSWSRPSAIVLPPGSHSPSASMSATAAAATSTTAVVPSTTATSYVSPSATESASPTNGVLDLAALSWETIVSPFGGPLAQSVDGVFVDAQRRIVAWGRDQEAADGGGTRVSFWRSGDGRTWDETKLGNPGDVTLVRDVASTRHATVAVGTWNDAPTAWVAIDPGQWEAVALRGPEGGPGDVSAIAAGDQGFLAVGSVGESAAGWFSADGLSWERVGDSVLRPGRLMDVTTAAGGFVAVGVDESGDDWDAAAWMVSASGAEWQAAKSNDAIAGPQDDRLLRVWAYSGGLFAFGEHIKTEERVGCTEACWWGPDAWSIYRSNDGISWERSDGVVPEASSGEPALYEYSAITSWNDHLLAVGAGTDWRIRVWTSRDGLRWRPAGDEIFINGDPAPPSWQDDVINDLVVTSEGIVAGGQLAESDGFILVGRP